METENPHPPSSSGNDSPRPGDTANPIGTQKNPSDYYAAHAPPPASGKGCPKWLLTGCGLGGCLMLIVIFVGGAFFMKSGLPKVLDYAFSKVEKEVSSLAAPEVTIEQKDALRDEIALFRKNIREDRIQITEVQPVLKKLQNATSDQRLSPEEFDELTADLRLLNAAAGSGKDALPSAEIEGAPASDTVVTVSDTDTITSTETTTGDPAPNP